MKKVSKRVLFILLAMMLLLGAITITGAQSRGLEVAAKAIGGADLRVGKQYAVLIGIDRYQEWTPLRNPVKDAKAVKDILARRYYIDEFIELYDSDATAVGIRRLFGNLVDRTGPADSVLIYYAGHGYTDRFNNGFWIPVDGGKNIESQDRWIQNQQIRNFVTLMKARSVVLVIDSCFSGDLLNVGRGVEPVLDSEYFRNALKYNARQVLTSGASETVPDESEFARQFRTFLENNTEAYVDPYAMYDRVRRGVSKSLPLFGTLPGQEQGGSFVLFLKTTPASATIGGAGQGSAAVLPATARATQTGDAELMVSLSGATGAELYVNGSLVGSAPALIQKLPSGLPLVVEARSGLDAGKVELTLKPRELKEVTIKLERMKGNLFIEASEKDVEVWLDGKRLGPLGTGLFRDLAAGEHVMELKGKDLYHTSTVTIPGNETLRTSARLVGVGYLDVDAPAGTRISLSGPGGYQKTVFAPATVADLPEGNYTLGASGSGFLTKQISLSIRKGISTRWTPYTTGQLRIQASPATGTIQLGGQVLSLAGGALTLDLPPGVHRLSLRSPGYHEKVQDVAVELGKLKSLQLTLNELARASLTIPDAPFGARLAVGTSSSGVGIGATSRDLQLSNLPAGIPLAMEIAVPFADSLNLPALFKHTIFLVEGGRQTLVIPSGQFSLPWLPEGASLVFAPKAGQPTAIPLQPDGQGWRSPLLATGTYTVSLRGSHEYRGQVTIQDGQIIELPGYRDALGKAIDNDIMAAQRQLKARAGRRTAGWVSLVAGLASSGAAAAAYYLGGQAWDTYQNAQATQDALDAKAQAELWGTVLPIAAAAGGLGLGLAPILWSAGPDPMALERSIAASEESLKKLRGK